jgi:glycosyltransferase involved in cell wall biosynthesis
MELKGRKWITCTPRAFRGDEKTFFGRDSGLCCRALQQLGAEAKVVMLEPAWDDEPDVMRVAYERLEDPRFWRERNVDAVILYSWAKPIHTAIAEAIHDSGTKLYLNMDTGGLISPFVEPCAYSQAIWRAELQKHGVLRGAVRTVFRIAGSCVRLDRHFSRLRHMAAADVIGVVSPVGAERIRKYARFFGRKDVAQKVFFVSHPIDSKLHYDGSLKAPSVIVIGRWDDSVKQPQVMMDVAVHVLRQHPAVRFSIVGKEAMKCAMEVVERVPHAKDRIAGHERLEHDELSRLMSKTQVSLCTSRSEGFHTVSAEALMCGCSVVGPRAPGLASLPYFVDEGRSGRLCKNTSEALSNAVLEELDAWAAGDRDAGEIARIWRSRLSAENVMARIDSLLFQAGKTSA